MEEVDLFHCLDLNQVRRKSMREGMLYHLVNLIISFKERESAASQYRASFHILMKMNHETKE